jgi:hypothetical protein
MSHISRSQAIKRIAFFVGIILVMYVFILKFLSEDDFTFSKAWDYQGELFANDTELGKEAMFLELTLNEPDAETQMQPIIVKPWGMGYRGISISDTYQPLNDIDLVVDMRMDERVTGGDSNSSNLTGAYGRNQGNQVVAFEANKNYGPFQGESSLSVMGNREFRTYPFDRYEGWLFSWANYYESGRPPTIDSTQMTKIPLGATIQRTSLGTFKAYIDLLEPLTYLPYAERNTELNDAQKEKIEEAARKNSVVVGFQFERDASTKFLALLVYLIILMSMVSVLAITFSVIRGHRPPSLNATIWAIAVIFTSIQIRGVLPGDPAIGLWLDIAILFPALILVTMSAGALVFLWLKRIDYHV